MTDKVYTQQELKEMADHLLAADDKKKAGKAAAQKAEEAKPAVDKALEEKLAKCPAAALLAGAAVSFAGLLSFVGLLAPHIARRLVGNNHRILLPAAMLLGAAFVVLCDVLARCLFAPFELPVGILLSLIGGPFFLGLLLHGRGRRMYD